jgi:hypothetical protein
VYLSKAPPSVYVLLIGVVVKQFERKEKQGFQPYFSLDVTLCKVCNLKFDICEARRTVDASKKCHESNTKRTDDICMDFDRIGTTPSPNFMV